MSLPLLLYVDLIFRINKQLAVAFVEKCKLQIKGTCAPIFILDSLKDISTTVFKMKQKKKLLNLHTNSYGYRVSFKILCLFLYWGSVVLLNAI